MKSNAAHARSSSLLSERKAFSLIETALALGIVAFAFVGLMGMLPAGLSTFRKAVDTTVSAQIVQHIVSDAEQADFDNLAGQAASSDSYYYALKTRFFDDQGNEIVPTGGNTPTTAELQRILYHVRVRGSLSGHPKVGSDSSQNFTSLPQATGDEKNRFHPRDSTFLTIQIANNPANKKLQENSELLWDPAEATKSGVNITTQSAVVTRSGPKKNAP